MGAIISRFRKEKTTYQILENLEEKIKDIEAYTISTQARQKRFVANFLVISIGLYVISFAVFYFVFFPPTWNERIIHSLPLLICPMIITLVKKLLAWYFERKVIINTNELKQLREEKKKILEKVMDKETYKVAVDILNKFGDKQMKTQTQALGAMTPMKAPQQLPGTPKGVTAPIRSHPVTHSAPTAQMAPAPGGGMRPMPNTPIGFNVNTRQQTPGFPAGMQQRPIGMVPGQTTMPYRRTPYPIINHNQKGVLEKMVDYLVGDGPNSRFAMICRECLMHNGMALQEEYEYAAFRCAFCGSFNPAKKQRPTAPKLPFEQALLEKQQKEMRGSSSSLAESDASSTEETNSAEVDSADQEQTTQANGTPVQDELDLDDEEQSPESAASASPEEETVAAGDVTSQDLKTSEEQSKPAGVKSD